MAERILSIAQAADETPWSESTLYRIAPEPGSPFRKVAGRWVTTTSELVEWARSGEKPATRRPAQDPMPRRRRSHGNTVLAEVRDLQRRAA